MAPTRKPPPPLNWSEIGALALLGGIIVVGLLARGPTLDEFLVSLGFLGGFLLLAWLWQWTLRWPRETRPLTRGQWLFQTLVFVIWLVVMALGWSYFIDRESQIQRPTIPTEEDVFPKPDPEPNPEQPPERAPPP